MMRIKAQTGKQDKLFGIVIVVLFFFMAFFPYSNNGIKIIFLSILMLITLFRIVSGKLHIYPGTRYILLIIGTNLFFIAYGLLNKAPGAIKESTVTVIWPICYFLLGSYFPNGSHTRKIIKILMSVSIIIAVFDIFYIVTRFYNISFLRSIYEIINVRQRWGYNSGIIAYEMDHTDCLAFFLPFSATLFFLYDYLELNSMQVISKTFVTIAFCLNLVAILLTSRTALLIETAVVLFCLYIYKWKVESQRLRNLVVFLTGVIILIFLFIYFNKQIMEKMDSLKLVLFNTISATGSQSNDVRHEQLEALTKGWLERPFFGHGLGSYTPDSIRDSLQPWNYELTYSRMLFQTGLVGTSIFVYAMYKTIKRLWENKEFKYICCPSCVALCGVLLANGSNPFVGVFALMWMQYLPMLISDISLR